MTNLWLYWILAIVIGSTTTGIIKSILSIKIYSEYCYGSLIYGYLNAIISMIIGYILLSAIAGHWLK